MNDQIVTVIVGVLQSGAAFLIFRAYIKSLRIKVEGLEQTIGVQSKTIEAMERRVGEAEKIGELYKSLVNDLPAILSSLSKGKDQIIRDLEATIEHQGKLPKGEQNKQDKEILLTMRFLLGQGGSELGKLAQLLAGNIESAAVLLSKAKSFEEFVASVGGTIAVEPDKQKFETSAKMIDEKGNVTGVLTTVQSLSGFYAVFSDKRVLLSPSKLQNFQNAVSKLAIEIGTLI